MVANVGTAISVFTLPLLMGSPFWEPEGWKQSLLPTRVTLETHGSTWVDNTYLRELLNDESELCVSNLSGGSWRYKIVSEFLGLL